MVVRCGRDEEARMKSNEDGLRARIASHPQVTPFRRSVYEALLEVPRGCVTTYGELARRVGCRSAQAVGGALRENPFAPEVPCHRVVAADWTIGGFCGCREGEAIRRKRALLKSENVRFDRSGKLSDERCRWAWKNVQT